MFGQRKDVNLPRQPTAAEREEVEGAASSIHDIVFGAGPMTWRMLLETSGAIVGTARVVNCVTESASPSALLCKTTAPMQKFHFVNNTLAQTFGIPSQIIVEHGGSRNRTSVHRIVPYVLGNEPRLVGEHHAQRIRDWQSAIQLDESVVRRTNEPRKASHARMSSSECIVCVLVRLCAIAEGDLDPSHLAHRRSAQRGGKRRERRRRRPTMP